LEKGHSATQRTQKKGREEGGRKDSNKNKRIDGRGKKKSTERPPRIKRMRFSDFSTKKAKTTDKIEFVRTIPKKKNTLLVRCIRRRKNPRSFFWC